MIIKRIHIDNFGKFSNYDLDLDNEFTVLYGKNEDGKSTLMAFIQMMFYGYKGRVRDISRNPRKRYMPWNGQEMKGFIEFEALGANYRLERSFGLSNTTDKISAWNLDKGEQVNLPRSKDPGQVYFQMDADAFDKSVFIGQSGSIICDEEGSGEITNRLLNLVTTGKEDISHKKVEQRLQVAQEAMVSRSKSKGTLVDQRNKLAQLQSQKYVAEQDELDKAAILDKINHMAVERNSLEQEKKQLEESIRIFDLLNEKSAYEEALKQKTILTNLIITQKQRKAELLREGIVLDQTYLANTDKLINDLERLERSEREANSELDNAEISRASLLETKIQAIPAGTVDSLKAQQKSSHELQLRMNARQEEIDRVEAFLALEKELNDLRSELQELNREYGLADQNAKAQADINREQNGAIALSRDLLRKSRQHTTDIQRDIYGTEASLAGFKTAKQSLTETYEGRIEYTREGLAEASKPKEVQVETVAGKVIGAPLVVAVLIMGASIALGITVDPLLYLLALVAIIPLFRALRPAPPRLIRKTQIDNQLIEQLTEKLEQQQDEYATKLTQAQEEITKSQQALDSLKALFEQATAKDKETESAIELKSLSVKAAENDYNEQLRQRERTATLKESLEKQIAIKTDKQKEFQVLTETNSEAPVRPTELNETLEHLRYEQKDDEIAKNQIKSTLVANIEELGAVDLDQLYELDRAWHLHNEKLKNQHETVEKSLSKVKQISEQHNSVYKDLLETVSYFKQVSDKQSAQDALDLLRGLLIDVEHSEIAIKTYSEKQSNLEKSHSADELKIQVNKLQHDIDQLAPEGLPQSIDEKQLEAVRANISVLRATIAEQGEQIASQEASMREKYRQKKNISQIENEIEQVRAILAKQEDDYAALLEASKVLEESFAELQKNFGPLVNDKTAEIFSHLTDGKYDKVKVSRNFDIMIEDSEDNRLREWSFLSSGTVDQAYLSLRMAIAELVTAEHESLPLLLDDVFSQYDDERALHGLKFMAQYRFTKNPPLQILLFTCHLRIRHWAENELTDVQVKTIV